MSFSLRVFALILLLCVSLSAQTKKPKTNSEEADAEAAQQRTIAISLVTSLADEARSFKDQTRRARVQARAADVLWDTDPDRARELFRRAWEAADTADIEASKKRAEEMKRLETAGEPVVVRGGPSLRSEVLRLAARRDRNLGEEFLKALDEANEKARAEMTANQRRPPGFQVGGSQRLQLARRLVEEGEVERALEFATPALDSVNVDSIFFLSALREKNAQLADAAYTSLLARAARDPNSDGNTVSGLSSYLFTPFLYITFERNGGANQNQQRGPTAPPAVDDALRTNFLKVAFQTLMQPLPAPDQDRTTTGPTGKYLIIKRLLPLFEQYAPDLAPGLRTQMTALASSVPATFQQGENRAVSRGILPEGEEGDPYQRMQERLDRAKTSDDRDAIYADYAVAFAADDDPRGRELVDKIENSELRKNVKAYTDFERTDQAIQKKDSAEKYMVVVNDATAQDFDLLAVFRHLARADLLRAVQLAKTFTGEAPRAVATLAVARSVLEKRKDPTPGGTN